jgi:hypothetical protein
MRFWPGDGVYVTGSTLFVAFQEIENRAWIFRRYREQESYPDLFSYLPHLINFFFNVFESHRNCFSDQIPNVTRERIAFFDSKSTDTGEKIDCPTAQFSQKESQVKEIWSFYRHIANKSCLSHMWTDFLAIFDRILFQKYLISFVQATKSAAVFYCALTFWAGCREFRSAWTTTVNAYKLHEIPECLYLRPSTDAGRASSYHDRYWVALVHPFMGADPGLLAQWRVRWRASSFTAWINFLFFV